MSSCCDGADSPAFVEIAKLIYEDKPNKSINVHFDHGLGDCVHFIAFCKVLKDKYGITVNIHYEDNKKDVFVAAGIQYAELKDSIYHRWTYPPDFNYPETVDGNGSKLFGNILLRTEQERRDFYSAMVDVDLTDMLQTIVTKEATEKVNNCLKDLPCPFILLHLWGTNLAPYKNLDNHLEVYNVLLDMFDGTLILLDWDNRATRINHSRVRHFDTDFHLHSIAETAALFDIANITGGIMIGVDSGPYHLTAMHPIPSLGIFHHHYPACVSLPSPKQVVMTRNADSYKPCNRIRRKRWNIVEYSDSLPSPSDVATQAQRMLEGVRYSRGRRGRQSARLGVGADVMLQQWVRDWLRQSTNLCSRADRDKTMDYLFREINLRFMQPTILETGCIRSVDDWSAGYSTYLFAVLLDILEAGKLITVDNNQHNLDFALQEIKSQGWGTDSIQPYCMDSCEYLTDHCNEDIDVLYLDSLDVEHPDHANYAMQEIRLAEKFLHNKSIVVLDDTGFKEGRWIGKGAIVVPYLLNKGWKILSLGYQVLMSKYK